MPLPMPKLKSLALEWAIDHCHRRLGLGLQRLSIAFSNRPLSPGECGPTEKKIVIGDDAIVIYQHYSEPGNPFLAERFDDFDRFMRVWLGAAIKSAVQSWIVGDPAYGKEQEQAAATGDWVGHMTRTLLRGERAEKDLHRRLEEVLAGIPIRLAKRIVLGRGR